MVRIIDESFTLIFALGIGIYAFRSMNLFYRIFFYQLLAYILIYILSHVTNIILLARNMPQDNQWVFNVSMPMEAGILTWAAYEYFKNTRGKIWIWIGYAAFLVVLITEISIKGIWIFSNHGCIAESALLLILYLLILYSHFTSQNSTWKRSPELWICLGIVLFYGGVVPYFSLMHYLQASYPKVNAFLYYFIIDGLATLRYVLLAVGFWFVRRNALQTALLSGNNTESGKTVNQ
jgi:hypothetical protein